MTRLLSEFVADQSGAAAVEYGLVVSLISVTIVGVLAAIGLNLQAKIYEVADLLANAGR
jgi:pilus assembly protein Flp/PilA